MKTKPLHADRLLPAFSLLELMVVAVVLFVLGAILQPAISNGRQRSQSQRCLFNLRELTGGWLMYAAANSDHCANNFSVAGVQSDLATGAYRTWCEQVEDGTTSSQNTNIALLRDGTLNSYLGGNADYFHCPSDSVLTVAQIRAGWLHRARSYSMSGFFGLDGTTYDATYGGRNPYNGNYRQFLRLADLPEPTQMWLFLEEHPYSINDGYFDIGAIPNSWTATTGGSFQDVPSLYHLAGTSFSFADGHAEVHRWLDGALPSPWTSSVLTGNTVDRAPYNDIQWMWTHSSVRFE